QLEQAGAELTKVIAGIWPVARKLLALEADFRTAVPLKSPDWDQFRFTQSLMALIGIELYVHSNGALRPSGLIDPPYQLSQNPLSSIVGALREHIAMGFKALPKEPEPAGAK